MSSQEATLSASPVTRADGRANLTAVTLPAAFIQEALVHKSEGEGRSLNQVHPAPQKRCHPAARGQRLPVVPKLRSVLARMPWTGFPPCCWGHVRSTWQSRYSLPHLAVVGVDSVVTRCLGSAWKRTVSDASLPRPWLHFPW